MKRLRFFTFAPALLALVLAATAARSEEIKLLFADVVPAGSVIDAQVVGPWAKRVNEQGKGVLSVEVRQGPIIADFSNIYDRVLGDVVQIGWEIQAAVGGKFPLSNVVALPLFARNGADASTAFWRVYKSGAMNAEYNQIVPLMLVALPGSALHFSKPLRTLETLGGAKLIVPGKVQGEAIAALGATPISLPLTDMYPAIQRNTVDGTMIAWVAFNPWKLADVTSYHVDTVLGGAAGMIFMAKAKYDALPPAARKIIDDNSGEALSRQFGATMEKENDAQRASVKANPKQIFVELTPDQTAAWQKKVEPVIAQWTKDNKGADIVLQRFRAELANAKAGH